MFGIDTEMAVKVIAPLLVALIGGLLKRHFEAKAKLVTYLVHSASNPLPLPRPVVTPSRWAWLRKLAGNEPISAPLQVGPQLPDSVHTHAIVVRNVGKKTAHNVRIGHAFFPPSYSIFPPTNHQVLRFAGYSGEIYIPTLVPQEQVTVSYLYFPPLLWNQVIGPTKCDEGLARAINAIPSTPWPKIATWTFWTMAFIGASSVLYWAFWLIGLLLVD